MKGILCAYLRATEPRTPNVDATALQPPSMASSTIFSPSKYAGFAEKDAPARRSSDRKSTRLNSSHSQISYAVFCLKKKKKQHTNTRTRHNQPTAEHYAHTQSYLHRHVHDTLQIHPPPQP